MPWFPPSTSFEWVSDVNQVTYEIQPPSYTVLKVLTGPPRGGGGDTLWASQYAVYDLLSPGMQKYLEGLEALHSAQIQADGSIAIGRTVRREPVVTKHPLIRTHPVTGWKSVFFNPGKYIPGASSGYSETSTRCDMFWLWGKLLSPLRFVFVLELSPCNRHADVEIPSGFVTEIVGIPKAEAQAIIYYLNELITTTQEIHVRFQWQKNDVAFWDNRICVSNARPSLCTQKLTSSKNHSASFGFAPHRRHAVRVAAQAERPYFDPTSKSQEEEMNTRYGLPQVNKDGSSQSNYND